MRRDIPRTLLRAPLGGPGTLARGVDTRAPRMGKTKKRQAKRAAAEAARLEQAWGASGERVGAALAAAEDGMHVGDARDANDPRWIAARDNSMDPDSRFKFAQVKLKRNPMAGVSKPKTKQKTGILRIARAVEASLTQEACVALDTLLAECERGEREVAAPMDLCGKVLAMCQRGSFGKPAVRLLGRMERVGLPVGPVQLRQVFFACCGKGMVAECLSLMSRHDIETGRRLLGKDVLVRGCGLMPGGVDGPAGLALLEGTLRGIAGGGWEGAPDAAGGSVRIHAHPTWRVPRRVPSEGAVEGAVADPAADAERLAPTTYPGGDDGNASFWFVCDDDGRRRPADRNSLELWAPATASTIPLAASGLELETERHDVPNVPGAFALTDVFSAKECAALRAAAHAIGWRRDEPDPSDPGRGRLDYCELVVWPETAERIWDRIKMHMPAGAAGVNARMRFFRYGPDTIYRRHVDGSWPDGRLTEEGEYVTDASKGTLRSRLTLLFYLSEGFLGGNTTFYTATPGHPGLISARGVAPREGCALCFPHGDAEDSPVHEGSAVGVGPNGVQHKYIIRTDVLFESAGRPGSK